MGLKLVPAWLFAKDIGEEDKAVGLHLSNKLRTNINNKKSLSRSLGKTRLGYILENPWNSIKTSRQCDTASRHLYLHSLAEEIQQTEMLGCHNFL